MLGYLQRNLKMQIKIKWAPIGILNRTTIMMISKITNVIEMCIRSHLFTVRAKEINQYVFFFRFVYYIFYDQVRQTNLSIC